MKTKLLTELGGPRGQGPTRRDLIGGLAAASLMGPLPGWAAEAEPLAGAMAGPAAPGGRVSRGMEDRRAAFAALNERTADEEAFRAAFVQSKLRIAATDPGQGAAARQRNVASLAQRLGVSATSRLTQPTPGGVGYGPFYTAAFKTAWALGTSVACEFICPTPPGGNVNTWLYLTATNRSGLGVEAFVSYNGQGTARFKVFDWARTDQWQTDIPFTSLASYLATRKSHGATYQVLPVWNSTWRLSGSTYRNQALLYNRVRGGWDLIYHTVLTKW